MDAENKAEVGTFTTFKVVYKTYQYNTGAGDNGTYTRVRSFQTINDAFVFALKIKDVLHLRETDTSGAGVCSSFEDELCDHNGYLEQLVGVFRELIVRSELTLGGDF